MGEQIDHQILNFVATKKFTLPKDIKENFVKYKISESTIKRSYTKLKKLGQLQYGNRWGHGKAKGYWVKGDYGKKGQKPKLWDWGFNETNVKNITLESKRVPFALSQTQLYKQLKFHKKITREEYKKQGSELTSEFIFSILLDISYLLQWNAKLTLADAVNYFKKNEAEELRKDKNKLFIEEDLKDTLRILYKYDPEITKQVFAVVYNSITDKTLNFVRT